MKRSFDDEKAYKQQFWKNVVFLKELNKETDYELADLLGVTVDGIRCAREKKICSIRTLVQLSNHYGKTVEEMIEKDLWLSAKN